MPTSICRSQKRSLKVKMRATLGKYWIVLVMFRVSVNIFPESLIYCVLCLATARDEADTVSSDENPMEIKVEDEEELRKKRKQQIELLEKAAILLKNRIGVHDLFDGELSDFQDILDDGEDIIDDTIQSNADVGSKRSNENVTVNGRTFDKLSGFIDFSIDVCTT